MQEVPKLLSPLHNFRQYNYEWRLQHEVDGEQHNFKLKMGALNEVKQVIVAWSLISFSYYYAEIHLSQINISSKLNL